MFGRSKAYSGFAVDNVARAHEFYGERLGLDVSVLDDAMTLMMLHLGSGSDVFVYEKRDHVPALYTILNFPVEDIDVAVDALAEMGIEMERYPGGEQDARGIARGAGPNIAWFRDTAGNILSVLEEQ